MDKNLEETVCSVDGFIWLSMEINGWSLCTVIKLWGAIKAVEFDQLSDHWLLMNYSSVTLNSLKDI
jgi:hypothetical protein